jgi:hypothetical protein
MPSKDATKAFGKLRALEGAVNKYYNPHLDGIRSGSPSLNFTFGNGWSLPAGLSLLLWGPQKGGKTLVSNSMIGQLHKDSPDAFAVKFNTEHREVFTLNPQQMANWGIDPERYLAIEGNRPDEVYDRIVKDVPAAIEGGANVKLVVIDSINDILGTRLANRMDENDKDGNAKGSVMDQDRGDQAATNINGLRMVLGIQRKYKFGLIIIAQQRAEQDQDEVMRGNKTRAGVNGGVLHHCEYYMHVERNATKAGKTSLEGQVFEDATASRVISATERKDDAELTGHKIRATMKDSSIGPKGRIGEFTIDYNRGIINVHEEVFLLGVNRGIIQRPNNTTYIFGDKKWTGGRPAVLAALREDPELQQAILKELRIADARGDYANEEAVSETEAE